MASGRDDVDQLLGISIEQLTKQVPFRHIPHRHDFYHLCFEPASLFSGSDRPYRMLHDLTQFSGTTKDRATFQIAGSTYRILRFAFKNLADEFHGSAEFRCDMVRSQITALLIRLHRLCLNPPSVEVQGYSMQLTNRFLSLLAKKVGKLHRPRYYTSPLSVSQLVLVDPVLAETGKSPSAWIRDRTLLEARRLLIYHY